MKKQIRILGIDDSPFNFNQKFSTVIGVVMRGGEYLDCVLSRTITVDGIDSTNVCVDMVNKTRYKEQLRAIMIDGIAFGGFNIINIKELFNETGVPVISITRDEPNYESMKKVLINNFKNWKSRFNIIQEGDLHKINTNYKPIYIKYIGISNIEAKEIIKLSTIRGVIPEPIRIAHLIASGITKGESYGKA
jgi:endonuclease V-like protein UPF0215 family